MVHDDGIRKATPPILEMVGKKRLTSDNQAVHSAANHAIVEQIDKRLQVCRSQFEEGIPCALFQSLRQPLYSISLLDQLQTA